MAPQTSPPHWRASRLGALIALALGAGALLGCNRPPPAVDPAQQAADEEAKAKLVGTWIAWHDKKTEVLDLRADGTYRFVLVGDAVADFSGKWAVSGKQLELQVEKFVTGDRDRIKDKVTWGIEKIEANEIILGGATGNTTYTRKPEAK